MVTIMFTREKEINFIRKRNRMVKTKSSEKIEDEEYSLKQTKDEIEDLKGKWIKTPSTLRLIEFLEFYVKEKEKFIQTLKGFKEKDK